MLGHAQPEPRHSCVLVTNMNPLLGVLYEAKEERLIRRACPSACLPACLPAYLSVTYYLNWNHFSDCHKIS
jgi:hypothetical protein